MSQREFLKVLRIIAIIIHDPNSSLNPKQRVGSIIEEPMMIHGLYDRGERSERALELLSKVGLDEEQFFRYPHEFSGGQRQRIGIARALAANPEIVICDEPVSALDVSIQSQVINLLEDLQDQFDLGYVFIAHDLSVVRHISDSIGVMYLGIIVERAETDELFARPLHPYTQALLSAIPVPNPFRTRSRIKLSGSLPSLRNLPKGCRFSTRCSICAARCQEEAPEYREVSPGHFVACHLV
jgi:peptide/nickel transport system ATP-binding protein/oligopeptide transport system ATP-binding protein